MRHHPIFIAFAFASGKKFWSKLHYLILSALIPAVLLYGWMVWRSHQDIPINFLGPIDSIDEMISFIRRDNFSSVDSSASAGLIDKVYYVRYFITEWFMQLSLLGGLLALWGIIYNYRKGWRFGLYGEVATVFTSSFLLIWMLGFDYEYLQIAVFRPYLLVAYCILALWFGLGINAFIQVASKWHKLSLPIIYVGFSLIIIALGIYNGRTNYRANDRFAEELAQNFFDIVEQNSILVVHGDASVLTTAYYHLIEGKRPDISLLENGGYLLNNRIVQPSWSKKQKTAAWQEFASNIDRPLYYQSLSPDIQKQTGQSLVAFIYKMNKSTAIGTTVIETNDMAKQFFKKMIALPMTQDRWNSNVRNRKIGIYGQYLGYSIATDHHIMKNHIKDILPLAENNYWSLMGMVSSLSSQDIKYIPIAEKYLEKAKHLADDKRSKSDVAKEFYLEGVIAKKKGNSRKARNLFRKSIKISSKKDNPSYKALKEL